MSSVDWPGILIGGAITFLVSLIFYVPQAISLKRESARLRHNTNMILRAMHNEGLAEVKWDEHGEPEGLVIRLGGVAGARSSASGELTVGDEDAPTDQG